MCGHQSAIFFLFGMQLRDADNLQPVSDASKQATLLAIAAWFPSRTGTTVRLIDNAVIGTLKS